MNEENIFVYTVILFTRFSVSNFHHYKIETQLMQVSLAIETITMYNVEQKKRLV